MWSTCCIQITRTRHSGSADYQRRNNWFLEHHELSSLQNQSKLCAAIMRKRLCLFPEVEVSRGSRNATQWKVKNFSSKKRKVLRSLKGGAVFVCVLAGIYLLEIYISQSICSLGWLWTHDFFPLDFFSVTIKAVNNPHIVTRVYKKIKMQTDHNTKLPICRKQKEICYIMYIQKHKDKKNELIRHSDEPL